MARSDVRALAIDPLTPTIVYAGTSHGDLYKSVNSGTDWTQLFLGMDSTSIYAIAIDPTDSDILYVGGGHTIYKSTDGGQMWSASQSNSVYNVSVLVIDPVFPTILYAGNGNGVYKSIDGGETWDQINNGQDETDVQALAIDPQLHTTIYAGADSMGIPGIAGNIYKSVDGGESWTSVNHGVTEDYFWSLAIDPTNSAVVYVGTHHGLYKTLDSGETWSQFNNGLTLTDITTLAIAPSSPNIVYAGTFGAGVFVIQQSNSSITTTMP